MQSTSRTPIRISRTRRGPLMLRVAISSPHQSSLLEVILIFKAVRYHTEQAEWVQSATDLQVRRSCQEAESRDQAGEKQRHEVIRALRFLPQL